MFSIGFGEIIVIGVVALLVIGPKQLPQVARTVGRLFGELKKATEDLSGGLLSATRDAKEAIHKATDIDEMMKPPEGSQPAAEGSKEVLSAQSNNAESPSSNHENYEPPDHSHSGHDDGDPFDESVENVAQNETAEASVKSEDAKPVGSSNESS